MKSTWHSDTGPGIKEVILWAVYQQQKYMSYFKVHFSANVQLMKVILKTNQIRKEKCVIFLMLELYMIIKKNMRSMYKSKKAWSRAEKESWHFPRNI